ncbi:hypothetical protein ACNOYE_13085 [Nannocystaceae bacterium ST9]
MSEASPHWVEGRLVDGDPAPSWPWARVLAVVALILLFDLVLRPQVVAGRRSLDAVDLDALATRMGLRAQLQAAVDDPRRSILLVGDSVLAGDVMAGRVDDWDDQRALDHLRRVVAEDAELGVQQIALDGLLPIDALHLLAELDRRDPAGRVEFVFEINLRYFSDAYVEQRECSRPAICELGGPIHVPGADEASATIRALASDWALVRDAGLLAHDELLARLPVFRWRDRLPDLPPTLERVEGLLVGAEAADEPASDEAPRFDRAAAAEAEARVREHYRSADLSEHHLQSWALSELLDRLARTRRPALLFVTPLADDFERRSLPPERLGALQAELARRVADQHAPTLELISLDHPLFVDHLFLDHCHLGPTGNRLLALNLAYELGLPLAERPANTELIHVEDHDRSLVHRVARGFAEGPAWAAEFANPRGVTASADGRRIVVADTGNRRLRQLRGNLQIVEVLAGHVDEDVDEDLDEATEAAIPEPEPEPEPELELRDGDALRDAVLIAPREPVLIDDPTRDDDPVYFLDGEQAELVRLVVDGRVSTLRWRGPGCAGERLRPGPRGALWLLCRSDRVLAIDPIGQTSRVLREDDGLDIRAIASTPANQLLFADALGRIFALAFDGRGRHGPAVELFANLASEPLPSSRDARYPFGFDELRLSEVVDMIWIERYGMLLVADELPLGVSTPRREREIDERIQLRVLDFETEQIWPWLKPIPHGEAWTPWNQTSEAIVSYFHRGSFTLVQAEAGLIWLEHNRSRLLRMADGLLGIAKLGHAGKRMIRVGRNDVIGSEAPAELERTLRPDRFLDRRWEPLARRGPYVGLLVGSTLTALSDRLGNYSLARRLELELQRELGYRDGLRFDLFHRSVEAGGLDAQLAIVEQFVADSIPLDVLIFEVHGFGRSFEAGWRPGLERLAALAARSDALVVVFDDSALLADRRDGLRATPADVQAVLDEAEALGMVVLEPSDRLLRELMNDAPWGSAPWLPGQRHGAPWAIDHTARALRSMLYPILHDWLRDRRPARGGGE